MLNWFRTGLGSSEFSQGLCSRGSTDLTQLCDLFCRASSLSPAKCLPCRTVAHRRFWAHGCHLGELTSSLGHWVNRPGLPCAIRSGFLVEHKCAESLPCSHGLVLPRVADEAVVALTWPVNIPRQIHIFSSAGGTEFVNECFLGPEALSRCAHALGWQCWKHSPLLFF